MAPILCVIMCVRAFYMHYRVAHVLEHMTERANLTGSDKDFPFILFFFPLNPPAHFNVSCKKKKHLQDFTLMSNINTATSHQFSFSQFGNNNKLTPPFNSAQFCHGLAPSPFFFSRSPAPTVSLLRQGPQYYPSPFLITQTIIPIANTKWDRKWNKCSMVLNSSSFGPLLFAVYGAWLLSCLLNHSMLSHHWMDSE